MIDENYPRFMNLTQTRKFLGIGSPNTIYSLIENNGLPVIYMGSLRRVDQVALNEWLQENTAK
ncbi:MAG: helix-turn-helix domain-containing protein [Ligilactobacillus acidipiscis]|jgi:excisionase family DNA binding protein|nr:helix-turn-helix domain-containing protein [Ligilactobacillus acidipiscis]MCI1953549.1 helix-turn-helix domain-containing protein [Ligilactobacillus acidipiscis]